MLTNRSMPLLQNAEAFEHHAAYRESSREWAGPDGSVTLRGATAFAGAVPPAAGDAFASAGSSPRRRRERARTAWCC